MTAPDLLGVFVRLFGLALLFSSIGTALENVFVGGFCAVAGFVIIATANSIVRLSYWQDRHKFNSI